MLSRPSASVLGEGRHNYEEGHLTADGDDDGGSAGATRHRVGQRALLRQSAQRLPRPPLPSQRQRGCQLLTCPGAADPARVARLSPPPSIAEAGVE